LDYHQTPRRQPDNNPAIILLDALQYSVVKDHETSKVSDVKFPIPACAGAGKPDRYNLAFAASNLPFLIGCGGGPG
jgi:hypothetical protein